MVEWIAAFGQWAGVLVAALAIGVAAMHRSQKRQQEASEKAHGEIKREIEGVHGELRGFRADVHEDFKAVRREMSERDKEIHHRLNKHDSKIGRIEGRMDK